jgi:hypothetical protein
LLVALACLSSGPARAGNTEHPRTPVVWPEAPCIRTVDRSVDPLLEFGYAIPFEDTLLSFDELEDSRTHQFIGFCRQWPAGYPPPRYISVHDLERAIAGGFEQLIELADPESTLETSVVWANCWTRITADDERRPITHEAADDPVLWDTSVSPAGTWTIAGYTWEPPYNLWNRAPWVVRVIDQDPPEQPIQAAATMVDTEDALYFDDSLEIDLCVDAIAGSSVTLEWVAAKADPFDWSPVSSTEIQASGAQSLTLGFAPPEPSWGATVLLRTTVQPPAGESFVAHALAPVIVYKPSSGDSGDAGESDESGETASSGEDESDPEGSTGDPPASGDDTATRAGRCSLDPERGNLPNLLFGLGLLLAWTRRFVSPVSTTSTGSARLR